MVWSWDYYGARVRLLRLPILTSMRMLSMLRILLTPMRVMLLMMLPMVRRLPPQMILRLPRISMPPLLRVVMLRARHGKPQRLLLVVFAAARASTTNRVPVCAAMSGNARG